MTTVTVLGLGPMGQALTRALLDAGVPTTVWNRTESKADGVRALGAAWAPTPADAVAASGVVLINVVDHAVVDPLIAAAGPSVAERTVVGLTSDTPDRARHTAELVHAAGGRYLDGAIMTPTDTIGSADASVLLAGPRELYDAHESVFATLATPTWLGEEYGRAAGFDMALLDFFWTSVSGFLHALKVAGANGIGASDLLPHAQGIVAILPPIIAELAERAEADRHDDSSAPTSSVAASLRHLIATSREAGVDAGTLESFRRYVDAAVDAGHGQDEISSVLAVM
ncbi:MAG TPA: NAD(P)-binding domain-containing protein [Mycobacterium sp.]|jgi:3-hydroxyisobutyrate dehydrogenase-like beta-hydroxyacid dehydrogenase|nr:NAD(P)-binding domain-containing protein [Mycobacterium sp.]